MILPSGGGARRRYRSKPRAIGWTPYLSRRGRRGPPPSSVGLPLTRFLGRGLRPHQVRAADPDGRGSAGRATGAGSRHFRGLPPCLVGLEAGKALTRG